ncbi:MAG: lipid-A-disaccharide synthase [Cyanobacteria bacterium P01_A01_bin.123]
MSPAELGVDLLTEAREKAAEAAEQQPVRILISTGEVSGDLQGALLIKALQVQAAAQNLTLEILALGGDRMAAAGATLVGNTANIGAVGILEQLPFVLPTLKLQGRLKRLFNQASLDGVVLIDYMGPNLSLGQTIQKAHPTVPIVYYIAPQQWVWSAFESETQQIVGVCNRLLAIFPAEATYYEKKGAQVRWVGHPLVDRIPEPPDQQVARQRLGLAPNASVVTLLPASRHQEIKYLMPIMFQAAQQIQAHLPQVQFLVAVSLDEFRPALQQAIDRYGLQATLVDGKSTDAIAAADLAIAKSGTVNLETALMNVPQVVMYRLNPVTAWIAKHILKFSAPFISPVNLTEMRPIVPEFVQWQATPDAIAQTSLGLLLDPEKRRQMLDDYQAMRCSLGDPGACDRAAQEILTLATGRDTVEGVD